MGVHVPDPVISRADGTNPEDEVLLADSVGLALHVVLEMLTPAERLAFVLHDMCGLPFDQVGSRSRSSGSPSRAARSRKSTIIDPERLHGLAMTFRRGHGLHLHGHRSPHGHLA